MVDAFRPSPDRKQPPIAMGANTSKVDADLALFSGELETSNRPAGQQRVQPLIPMSSSSTQRTPVYTPREFLATTTPTSSLRTSSRGTPSTSHQGSTLTAFTSSRPGSTIAPSTSTRDASPQSSVKSAQSILAGGPTPLNRLPPVESRETVRSQAAQITEWTIVDASDEIYESFQIGKSTWSEKHIGALARYRSDTRLQDHDAKPAGDHVNSSHNAEHSLRLPAPSDPTLNVPATTVQPSLTEVHSSLDKPLPSSPICQDNVGIVYTTESQLRPTNAAHISRKRPLPTASEPKKKRRLRPTPKAIEIATKDFRSQNGLEDDFENQGKGASGKSNAASKSEFGFFNPFPDGFPLTEEEEWLRPDPHPGSCLFQDSDHEDEGYWSQVVNSPASVEGETAEQQVERQMKLLARFHHGANTSSTSAQTNVVASHEVSEEDFLLKQARECMLKEQEAGAERSRRLREKALQRRGLLESPGSSSSSEQGKVFSDRHEDSSMSDLLSDEDDVVHKNGEKANGVQMEDLLDVAQEYTTKEVKAALSETKNTSKYVRLNTMMRNHSNDSNRLHGSQNEPAAPHPTSRTAAEQFRTQSRHIDGGCPANTLGKAPLSKSTSGMQGSSQSLMLEERERRLTEAKKPSLAVSADRGRRVSSPPFGNEIARGDFGSRTPPSGLQKPTSNLVSGHQGLGRAREERHAGSGHRSRSLIDRISSFGNLDEDYGEHDADNEDIGASRDRLEAAANELNPSTTAQKDICNGEKNNFRPVGRLLSGFELLAAKRQAQSSQTAAESSPPSPNSPGPSSQASGIMQTLYRGDQSDNIDTSSRRPMSDFQKLATKRANTWSNDQDVASNVQERPRFAPSLSRSSGTTKGLTLPHNFEQFPEEEKEVIVQHEIAKERKKDLDAAGDVFWHFAQLQCYQNRELSDKTMGTETNELKEIGKFIALVIDAGKPGKMRRRRILDIRDNIKRRIAKAAEHSQDPTEGAIIAQMRQTFTRQRIDFVHNELPKVEAEIEHLGDLRRSTKDKRKTSIRRPYTKRDSQDSSSAKKQVHFEYEDEDPDVIHIPDRALKGLRTPRAPKQRGSATVNRRQAQFSRQDRLIEQYKAQLKSFETARPEEVLTIQNQLTETKAEFDRLNQLEDRDSDSEEDDGAELVFSAGQRISKQANPDQDINEINQLEDARQKEAGTHATQRVADKDVRAPDQLKKSQAFSPELLRKMQLKHSQRLEANADPSIIKDKDADLQSERDSDADADAATEQSSDDDDDEEGDRSVFRYTICGVFRGFLHFEDADQYYFKPTYDVEQANKTVAEIISSLKKQIPKDSGVDVSRWESTASTEYGMVSQHITYGLDAEVEADVRIERELVDLEKKRYRQAKKRGAVVERATFTLSWERTITPIIEEKPVEIEPDCEGYEDLFDDTPEEKAKAREPIITRISQDEIEENMYTCPVLANRKAKEKWLEWLSVFFPGSEGYLRTEEDDIEQYLESLGDSESHLFLREDYFTRKEHGADGGERKVEDGMKLWVRKIAVKGPGN